jgi:thioredoxin reductase (NADPH)
MGPGSSSRAIALVICPGGQVLRNPGEDDLARCIGLVGPIDSDRVYDVVIVGAGQAGASARIENYMGFPTSITGMAFMARAYNQAQKFGVEMAIPDEAIGIQVPVEAADSEYIPERDGRQSRLAWAGGCMPPSPGVRLRPGL